MPIIDVKTKEEFEKAKAETKGQTVLEFVDMEGCGACQSEAPKVAKLAEQCADLTVVKVDVNSEFGNALADEFNVEALPTLYLGDSGAALEPTKVKEFVDSSALKKVIKCSRK